MEVPEHIDADITPLEIGDALRLEDLPPIENVRILDDPHETVIATVSAPRAIVEPEVEAELEGEEAEGEEGEPGEEAAAEAPPAGEASDEE
jgi:large subunit ribosomal protein L25